MREKEFENKIKAYLKERGHWYVKFFANSYTRCGVPDILACVNGHFIAIEVKNKIGKVSPLQIREIKAIRDAGGIALILRPENFDTFKTMIEDIENDRFI